MREIDGIGHRLFAHFAGTALHHHDAVAGTDDGDVQRTHEALSVGRIHNELTIDLADAHCTNRTAERNVRKRQRAACCVNANDIRIVLLVRGEDQGNYLRLIAEAFGEQWADGAINLAARQNFALAGTAFTLDEATGNAAACVGILAIIHGQRKEVDSLARIR